MPPLSGEVHPQGAEGFSLVPALQHQLNSYKIYTFSNTDVGETALWPPKSGFPHMVFVLLFPCHSDFAHVHGGAADGAAGEG